MPRISRGRSEPLAGPFDESDDGCDPVLEFFVAADQLGLGETILQPAQQFLGVVAERDRADTALGRGNEDRAERAFAEGEANDGILPPARNDFGVMPSAGVVAA